MRGVVLIEDGIEREREQPGIEMNEDRGIVLALAIIF